MREMAVVFDYDGKPIFWPGSEGSSPGHIPDSRTLWERIWEERERVAGVAHTHPGSGVPSPSQSDVTTFDAIESGLGRTLVWPIVTVDQVAFYLRCGDAGYLRACAGFTDSAHWVETINELRRVSQMGG